jgi:SAM-dependent methyltransferase
LCRTRVPAFDPYGVKRITPDRKCPTCGSLERHRLVWLFFGLRTDLFTRRGRMLHIAPEATMSSRISQLPGLDYLTGDLDPTRAMVQMDITDIHEPDDAFAVIYVSHVLEHVPDDVQAMRELRRVLAPDGWAVLEVPIFGETTREDPSITDPAERTRLFGQHDHVRMYGHDGEYERRLRQAGFDVEVVDLAGELGPAATRRFRLQPNERVYLCRKGAPTA